MISRCCQVLTLLALASVSAAATPSAPAGSGERVGVLGLTFTRDVTEGARKVIRERLRAGLAATGVRVISRDGAADGACQRRACWRQAWSKLGCRYVVGGKVAVADQSYRVELWLGDARTGKKVARAEHSCELCGLKALADRVDLAASALSAKLARRVRAPARLIIEVEPAGATLTVDRKARGRAPRELVLTPGTHQVTARHEGFVGAVRQVETHSGVTERLKIDLVPAPPPARRAPLRTAGWVGLGTGAAALGAGLALVAVNGNGVGCDGADAIAGGQCRQRLTTASGGWTLASAGLVAVATGAYLLYRAARASKKAARTRSGAQPRQPWTVGIK